MADPSGEERGGQEGAAEKEDPDTELGSEAGEALFFDEGFSSPPDEGAEHEENDHDGGEREGAISLAVGLLLLHDAEGGADYAAGAIGY